MTWVREGSDSTPIDVELMLKEVAIVCSEFRFTLVRLGLFNDNVLYELMDTTFGRCNVFIPERLR